MDTKIKPQIIIKYLVFSVITAVSFLFISQLLLSGVYAFIENVMGVSRAELLQISESKLMLYGCLVNTLIGVVSIAVFFVFYKLAFRKEKATVKAPLSKKHTAVSVIAGAGIYGISYIWIILAYNIPFLAGSIAAAENATSNVGGGSWIGEILLAVIIAPVLEEIVFRGLIFRFLSKVKTGWFAILISSIMFGVCHMNLIQAVYATIMGIIAAIVYAKTKKLIYPIFVHMANNLMGAIQGFVPTPSGALAVNIVALIMIIPMCYVMYKMLKTPNLSEVS